MSSLYEKEAARTSCCAKDIVLENVSKSFGDVRVLENLSLTFPASEITCIKGASGSGKTTLLKLIEGVEQPDSGAITGVPDTMAVVFQENRLSDNFTAVSNIRAVTGRSLSKDEIAGHLRELELGDALTKKVGEFSGGMKRRVAIARAICFDAPLVIMDEPFKGLDAALREKAIAYVKRHTAGKTLIVVTHDDADVALLGGRLITLE